MIKINIEIVATDREGHVRQRATLTTEEFISLRNQMNLIAQSIDNPPVEKKRFMHMNTPDMSDVSEHDKELISQFLSQAIARDLRKQK